MIDQAHKLRKLIKNSKTNENNKDKDIKIYAIASGKGGVGKTNFVVNTAIALQRKGNNVLIIDSDIGFANVDIVLGLTAKYTINDALNNNVPLKDVILKGPEGISIIPGGTGIKEMVNINDEQKVFLAEEFKKLEDIDIILIDTQAGISKNLLAFITFSKEIVIVTTPEPTAITDAYSILKIVDNYKLKKRAKVVINRAKSLTEANKTFDTLKNTAQSFLNIKLENLGYILDDVRVNSSVMYQEPFLIKYPKSSASKCVSVIADKLSDEDNTIYKIGTMHEVYNRLLKVFG